MPASGAQIAALGGSAVATFAPAFPVLWQFTTMSTAVTVCISGAAGTFLIANLAVLLAEFPRSAGFGTRRRTTTARRFWVAVVLCAASIGLGFLLNYVVANVPISISQRVPMFQTQSLLRFQAGFQVASEVTVGLPVKAAPICRPLDSKEPNSAAQVRMVDINSPNPHLQFVNFRHPQIALLQCNEPVTEEQVQVDAIPATVEIFNEARQQAWKTKIWIFGALLCVCNLIYVFRR